MDILNQIYFEKRLYADCCKLFTILSKLRHNQVYLLCHLSQLSGLEIIRHKLVCTSLPSAN